MRTYDDEGLRFAFESESMKAAIANSREEIGEGDAAHFVGMIVELSSMEGLGVVKIPRGEFDDDGLEE